MSALPSSLPDIQLVATWLKGWTLAKETAPPLEEMGGLSVVVNWPQQRKRYVFAAPGPGFRQLAETLYTPWVFLKVCTDAESLRPLLPGRWIIQPPGFMMTLQGAMHRGMDKLSGDYRLVQEENLPVPVVRILTADGIEAASGRVAFSDGYAVYDRIATHPQHRRRGLASLVMNMLEQIAWSKGIHQGILVATAEGKMLYESLGWHLYSPYTTAVIPGPDLA